LQTKSNIAWNTLSLVKTNQAERSNSFATLSAQLIVPLEQLIVEFQAWESR